jgi:hypothetical protein
MTTQALNQMLRRLIEPEPLTRVSRSIEIFGWVDLALGLLILIAPRFTATLFHLPPPFPLDVSPLRVVGVLVTTLGVLYILNGRFNSQGFAVGALLDRPLVPLIMAVLWHNHILPRSLAASFSIVDFSGFLATAFAWRADLLHGQNIGGPSLSGQTRAARSAEVFGWLILAVGVVTLLFPGFVASLLNIPSCCSSSGASYLQLAGLLTGGLGMLSIVGGSFDAEGFAISTVAVQLIAPLLVALSWWGIPRGLALAFVGISLQIQVQDLERLADKEFRGNRTDWAFRARSGWGTPGRRFAGDITSVRVVSAPSPEARPFPGPEEAVSLRLPYRRPA